MALDALKQIHSSHQGKVSDKWMLYLNEYDRLFDLYRQKKVRLLEIGVQNGGSLEVWGKYFGQAEKIVGCDIEQKCSNLNFEDQRIEFVLGDATDPVTQQRISKLVHGLDIIIDDGSHTSGDIVKAFTLYFPMVTDGGLYIVEDLHCSYWDEYSGGLYKRLSSMAFFKLLGDVLNKEHWGTSETTTDTLKEFFTEYDCHISEMDLEHLHSLEFINSMCVIRKNDPLENSLGSKCIAGQIEDVLKGRLPLNGTPTSPLDQSHNPWAKTHHGPASLNQALSDRERQIGDLTQKLTILNQNIQGIELELTELRNSLSWRVTLPFRMAGTWVRYLIGGMK